MHEQSDALPLQLTEELATALDRALGTSLDSLHVLRRAVREYSRRQKHRGVPLDNVMLALSAVLMEAEDDRHYGNETADVGRDPELARQLRAWCSEDYQSS